MCKAQYVFIVIVFLLSLFSFGRSQAQTQDLQQPMLAAHNPVRKSLHLPSLTWSSELAQYAQQWAQHLATHGCKMQHRQHAGQARLQVGENIYWASPVTWSDGRREVQAINAADVVSAWADEAQDYHYASNTCKAGKQCGHYTQVVWRDTKQVGCGMSLCPNQAQIWVCNYDPPGNWVGGKPY